MAAEVRERVQGPVIQTRIPNEVVPRIRTFADALEGQLGVLKDKGVVIKTVNITCTVDDTTTRTLVADITGAL